MKLLFLACLAVASSATKMTNLKDSISSKTNQMAQLGTVGPFKVINKDLVAKVSKEGHKVDIPHSQQRGAWNAVEGNALIEAWAVSENGLVIKQKDQKIQCGQKTGMDNQVNVAIKFTCMLEGEATLHQPMHRPEWPIKTGYDALHDQTAVNDETKPYDDADETTVWDPRVRFWHRCAGGEHNGLSLCNRYRFIAADAQGYYGCDYMTEDSYCVQSYRHEWVEFNPNDLPFVFNPASPCKKQPCLQ